MKKTLLLIGTLLLTASGVYAYSMPRWGLTAIDVYIPEHEYSSVVRSAFEEWSAATGNRVRFRYQSTRFASNNAPIRVQFPEETASYYVVESKRIETMGYFTNMDDGFINKANIKVYSQTKKNGRTNQQQVKSQMLREVGYILGLEKKYGKCEGEERSVMCMNEKIRSNTITDQDRQAIVQKYDRSNEDIKNRKNKN